MKKFFNAILLLGMLILAACKTENPKILEDRKDVPPPYKKDAPE